MTDVQPPLLGPTKRNTSGDFLERFYTPRSLAVACVERLRNTGLLDGDLFLEPSVGGGAFVDALRSAFDGATVHGVDMDPVRIEGGRNTGWRA